MLDELKLPKTLAKRLEKVAAVSHINPESIVKTAIEDRLNYPKNRSWQVLNPSTRPLCGLLRANGLLTNWGSAKNRSC